ncbi:MAG TPA: DUF58 domain-containing protein [Gemmatimonadaceae bacterium]|nr:DUF58 domain-containing protein [Gemmatimonadaceae bacterium]
MSLATFAPVLDAVRGIGWPALRRVRSAVPGPHVSRVRGTTAEFVEHRAYRQGDEPKRIDWKLVARTERVYIRLSQERAIQPTMLLLDASASMAFPAPGNDKWEHARRIGIGLAAVARHSGDPVGMLVSHVDGRRVVEPRTRRTVLEEMMHAVDVAPSGAQPLLPALREAMRRCRRLVIVTDFLGDADALLSATRAFVAAGNEVYAVHVVAQGELDPDPKKLLLADPEQPEVRRPMSPPARAAYLRRFGAWREQLARDWRRAGAVYTMVVPGQEPMRQTIRRLTTPSELARVSR